MDIQIKEVKNFFEDGKNKTKLVFSDIKKGLDKEIVFEGEGRLKSPVAEF